MSVSSPFHSDMSIWYRRRHYRGLHCPTWRVRLSRPSWFSGNTSAGVDWRCLCGGGCGSARRSTVPCEETSGSAWSRHILYRQDAHGLIICYLAPYDGYMHFVNEKPQVICCITFSTQVTCFSHWITNVEWLCENVSLCLWLCLGFMNFLFRSCETDRNDTQ